MTRDDRTALLRARIRAIRTHADLGHSGSWTSCPLPACRDAQRFVPPEIDLGDAEQIAAEVAGSVREEMVGRYASAGLDFETGEPLWLMAFAERGDAH